MVNRLLIIILFLIFPAGIYAGTVNIGQLITRAEQTRDVHDRIQRYAELAELYLEINPDSSVYFGEKMLTAAPDNQSKAAAYSVMGIAKVYLGRMEEALEIQKENLRLSLLVQDNHMLGNACNNVGLVFDYSGQYDSALYYYKLGLEYRKKNSDLSAIQGSLSNIGLVYYLKGDLRLALKNLYDAFSIAEYMNEDNGIASSATNISLVFIRMRDFKNALKYTDISQRIYEKNGWKKDIALGYNNYGTIYTELKEFDKALDYHFKSLRLKQEINDHPGIAMSLQNLGTVYNNIGEYALAEKYFLEGKPIADSVGDITTLLEIDNGLLLLYNNTGELSKSKNIIEEILTLIDNRLNEYINLYETYSFISKYYELTGNYEKAYQYKELFHALKDSVQNGNSTRLLAEKEANYRYEKKKREDELIAEQKKLKDEAEIERRKQYNYLLGAGIFSLLIIIFFALKNNRERKKANELLQLRNNLISNQNKEILNQKEIIEEKNKDITDSIQYAKRLQNAILPADELMNRALGDHFIYYQPKDIVSGDFYWTVLLENNDALFAVVDCTGHGVPGGFMSIVAHNALSRAVKEFNLRQPAEILDKVSLLIEENFRQNQQEEIRDGMDIALCLKKGNKLYYAGANNPLWILRTTNDQKEIIEIKANKQPIGYYEDRIPFQQHEITLQPGDVVYLFSDGYADQFGGPQGKKFKYSQLKELLISITSQSLNEQKKILEQHLNKWKGQLEQIDDICILAVKN